MNNPLKPTAKALISKYGGKLKTVMKTLDNVEFMKMIDWLEQLRTEEYARRKLK